MGASASVGRQGGTVTPPPGVIEVNAPPQPYKSIGPPKLLPSEDDSLDVLQGRGATAKLPMSETMERRYNEKKSTSEMARRKSGMLVRRQSYVNTQKAKIDMILKEEIPAEIAHLDEAIGLQKRDALGKTDFEDPEKDGHLTCTKQRNHKGIFVPSVNRDADPKLFRACQLNHHVCAHTLINQGANVNQTFVNMLTPAHVACYGGHLNTLKVLLAFKCDLFALDTHGMAPIHAAASRNNTTLVKVLIIHTPEVKHIFSNEGLFPLHVAAKYNAAATIDALLTVEPKNPDIHGKDGWRPLHFAAKHGHSLSCQVLIHHGARAVEPADENTSFGTPLHLAAAEGYLDVCNTLLLAGAEATALNKLQETPLHSACMAGNYYIAHMLLEHGAQLDVQSVYGDTPLHLAARNGHANCVKLLLQCGARVNIENLNGRTPLDSAYTSGKEECGDYLRQYGGGCRLLASENLVMKGGSMEISTARLMK